jgi:cbb3-type cytochrome c oxidase subunit III
VSRHLEIVLVLDRAELEDAMRAARHFLFPFTAIVAIPLLAASCSSARDDGPGFSPEPTAQAKAPPGPQPEFGPIVRQAEPPPPISGGTLAVDPSGAIAVAADSDRDRVYVVDLPTRALRHTVELPHRSEPGRVTIDARGRAHVVLRASGEVATIDLASGAVSRRGACPAPRGIAYDKTKNVLHVACAGGDLLTMAPDGGAPTRRLTVGRDLRDVVVAGGRLFATKFREAKLVSISSDGRMQTDPAALGGNLAWRAIAVPVEPSGDPVADHLAPQAAVVEQDPAQEPVRPEPGGYGSSSAGLNSGGECGGDIGIVSTRLELVGSGSVRIPSAVLPVDLATNGREFVVVAAGNAFTKELPQLFVVHAENLQQGRRECVPTVQGNVPGQAVAVAFDGQDELVVQTREPAALHIMTEDRRRPWKTITLSTDSKMDTGHAIFHSNAGGQLACASCHAEGADDSRAWEFVGMGPRRTPSLLGTLPDTEPFHWDGEMSDLRVLVDHVFVERMSGPKLDDTQVDALKNFIFKLPAPAKLRTEADVPPRGKELFQQRCTACHSGPLLTNNKTVDVGTGFPAQVPSLVGLGWRSPFIHTGCAKTLFDRFEPGCGGAMHGDTRDLTQDQIADLVAYLETL